MYNHRFELMIVMVAIMALGANPAHAGVIIDITQVGPDVLATGSGTINLTDLTLTGPSNIGAGMNPTEALIFMNAGPVTVYSGFTGPSSFGPFPQRNPRPSSHTGDTLGIAGGAIPIALFVPSGYVSRTPLAATDTFSNSTIASLGLTSGTYTWTWGTGADADSFTVQIAPGGPVPEPSTLLLAAFGGAVAFVTNGWSRHRRQQKT